MKGNVIDSKTDKRYIEKEEFEEIRKSARNLRDELLIQLLWDTGVRASEAIKIKKSDINFEEQKIKVQNAKEQKNTEQTDRPVYYSKRLSLLLRKWINNGHRESYMYTGSEKDEGHLLVTNQSPRMAVNRVNEIVKETIKRSSVDNEILYTDVSGAKRHKYTSHAFRHSFAVHRVKQGCPIIYLRDMLNHSTIEQTEDYLRFRDDDIKEAYRKYSP
ncbi:site-specific recombinase xerd [Halorubrum tebenquichense DSM 14210]|uniref:Site-specific recombinase xerd n=1 Tax=Halorubrum tebenquichense DSM 14210 TaxID=1227485 RepID=M0E241_9EURY|nr:site-specific recombinase xerd [Halorubrum tebenquichense DSM 14210]